MRRRDREDKVLDRVGFEIPGDVGVDWIISITFIPIHLGDAIRSRDFFRVGIFLSEWYSGPMNFIGHAFVSGSYDLFMAGHLLGDASNGALLEGAPDRLQEGVRAHHGLDRFTDRHPSFLEGSALLSETGGRYGPVLMDVAMDYFLVLHWQRWHDELFSCFVDRVYDVLRVQASEFPGAMGKLAEGIVERDYFGRFTSMDSLAFVFQRLAGRTSRPHLVRETGEVVRRHAGTLERLTLAFLDDPGIREYSAGCCALDKPSGAVSPR